MFQKVKESLKKVDIFGQSINLSFRQEDEYKTSVGGFTSICILGIILSFFYSNIIEFFAMTSVSSDTEFYFESDPSLIRLTRDNYMFAVQIDQINFTGNPYFNITAEQRHYKRLENGTQIKMPAIYLDMVQCTIEHFQPIFENYGMNFTDEFIQQGLSNFLCPNYQITNNFNLSELLVGGVYSSEDYYFLKFSVTTCIDNGQNNFTWKPTCKTENEVKKALEEWGSFRFQLFTTNYVNLNKNQLINPNKPKKYIQPYLAIDQFYTFVPNSMFVQSDIFLRTKDILTNKGILMYPDDNLEKIAIREYGDSRYQFEINKLTPGYYAAFYLDRSPYSYQINRKFLTLDELLSYLGGFVQFMIVVLGFFVEIYNKQHLIIEMANDLYEFSKNGQGKSTQVYLNSLISRTQQGKMLVNKLKKREEPTIKIQQLDAFTAKPELSQIPMLNKQENKKQKVTMIELKSPPLKPFRSSVLKQKASEYFESFKLFMKKQTRIGINFRMMISFILPFEKFMDDDCFLIKKAMYNRNIIYFIVNKQIRNWIYISSQINYMKFRNQKQYYLMMNKKHYLISVINQQQHQQLQDKEDKQSITINISRLYSMVKTEQTFEVGIQKQFQDLVDAYQKILIANTEELTKEQVRFNQRLIVLLGKELIHILESEIEICQSLISCDQCIDEDMVSSNRSMK